MANSHRLVRSHKPAAPGIISPERRLACAGSRISQPPRAYLIDTAKIFCIHIYVQYSRTWLFALPSLCTSSQTAPTFAPPTLFPPYTALPCLFPHCTQKIGNVQFVSTYYIQFFRIFGLECALKCIFLSCNQNNHTYIDFLG